ncbi:PREDICTED: natterin-1-like [Nicrophorus vespilloides]|uniref:Natterin-1-like n=1 Tax=Nicrophorus vespilloides TaxID=110193 RepID=A0ABM1N931_NICVS|nr:PREDICTED: natterin-1-like [Nicrophorus vespilloides]
MDCAPTIPRCCTPPLHERYYWVKSDACSGIPNNAVRVGVNRCRNSVFVGRTRHECDIIPGKYVPSKNVVSIGYGGVEYTKCEYDVLCEQRFRWETINCGIIPKGAVAGGMTRCGETLYIGRVYHQGTHTVGKVHPSHHCCYITVCGRELSCNQYEILVLE